MSCYIISYDLRSPSNDYEKLREAIKGYGTWAHITQSTWAIVTDDAAVDIRNHLVSFIGSDDTIFVVKSGVEAAWRNVISSNDWLKKHL